MAILGSCTPFSKACNAAQENPLREAEQLADSKKLFSLLTASETGIEFVSRLIPDHKYGYLYHSGMTCSGIAVGDLDGDSQPDLFIANGPGQNALYLQTGEGIKFQDVTESASPEMRGGEDWASGVAMADVDNDGDLDIYICNYETPNKLFLNMGSTDDARVRFEEVASIAGVNIVDASHVASFCDYDADGDLDFYLLTNRVEDPNGELVKLPIEFERPGMPVLKPGFDRSYDLWVVDADNWGVEATGRPDYLFRNDGTNEEGVVQFSDATNESGIAGRGDGLSCTWWDADLDGDTDLYVCNDFISTDRFYINNGDGTFTNEIAEAMPHTTWFSMGSNFGDIDNDGDFDLFVADMSATSHYKSKVTMGVMGGMTLKRANTSTPPQYMRNALYLNEGSRMFREAAYLAGLASSDWTWSVKINDFDSDGMLDIFLTNGVPREMNHSDIVITRDMLAGKHMWDFFKDGKMRKEKNLAYRNKGGLKFENTSASWGLDHLGASYGAVTSDLDADGDLDLVVVNLEENVFVYRNESSGKSFLTLELEGTDDNKFGVGAVVELQADGKSWIRQLMPGVGYHAYDEPILHFGLGEAKSIDSMKIRWPNGQTQWVANPTINQRMKVKQSASDNIQRDVALVKRTLFSASTELDDIWHVENQFNDFALQPLLPHELSSEGPCMAWADVNNDGTLDVFVGGSIGTSAEMRIGSDDGFKMSNVQLLLTDAAGEDAAATFADFDNDGDQDLLVGRGSYELAEGSEASRNILYLNDGMGSFSKSSPDSIPDSLNNTGTLAVADFDADGDLDVFAGNRVLHGKYPLAGPSELWQNDGKGKFTNVASTIAPELAKAGMVTDASWNDVNGDDRLDLIVAREFDTITTYLNDGKTLSNQKDAGDLSKLTGWWKSISVGDVDQDGDLDVLATNLGKNTKYKTSLDKPMTVYFGSFDETGEQHIVEVKQEGEVCYPERGRSCSSNAMPFIANKFDTFHDFGLASLSDIYGEDRLEAAHRFEANTFYHGVFYNDGNGQFTFKAFDNIVQIAPSSASCLADLDGDKDLDAVLGQNFFGPQSETGRYDGGLGQVLLNDGNGNLNPLPADKSGFLVRDAVTEIAVVDINSDQRPDIAVITNNGPALLFKNVDEGKQ